MDVAELQRQLHAEGFGRTYVWEDAPNAYYPDHTHTAETAHIILEGEMTLTCGGIARIYKAGERPPNVPAGAIHNARMGRQGCRYLIGEKL